MYFKLLFIFVILLSFGNGLLGVQKSRSRQKRCIVVQKQSGTHGDSTEGEDDRRPEIKEKRPERRGGFGDLKRRDVEEISPELLKYKILPSTQINDILRLRNRYRNRYQ